MGRRRDEGAYDYRKLRRAILADSDVCHLCGHAGADEIDHLVPVSRGGTHNLENLAPAHGTNGCPVCGRKCNQERGDRARTAGPGTPPPGCTRVPGSDRYLRMPAGQSGYWDTASGMQVSERWFDGPEPG